MTSIIFYSPKSLYASILGVFANLALLVVPAGLLLLLSSFINIEIWLCLVIGIPLGILLMIRSEKIVFPMVGIKHVFHFSNEEINIVTPTSNTSIPISKLKAVKAFEVSLEGGTVKHIVVEPDNEVHYDIFDTWVTRASMKQFDEVYKKYAT